MAKKCAAWCKRIAGKKKEPVKPDTPPPTPPDPPNIAQHDDHEPAYPWTSVEPAREGEIHNPTGIDIPWSSTFTFANHFGQPVIPPPLSPPFPAEPPSAAKDVHGECIHPDPFDETFMQVERNDEEPIRKETHRTDTFPEAGKIQGQGRTILEQIKEDRKELEKECGLYYPFANADDFAMAGWLANSGASMANIDKFLKLPFVRRLETFLKTFFSLI